MVQERTCDYTGEEIEPGTGKMYVKTDGTIFWFKDAKAEKNYFMGRESRDLEWIGYEEDEEAEEPADAEEDVEEADEADDDVEPAEEPDGEGDEDAAADSDEDEESAEADDADSEEETTEESTEEDEETEAEA